MDEGEKDDEITEHDSDPGNILLRAGYLRGMAIHARTAEDRKFLLRASRSLRVFASHLSRLNGDAGDAEKMK